MTGGRREGGCNCGRVGGERRVWERVPGREGGGGRVVLVMLSARGCWSDGGGWTDEGRGIWALARTDGKTHRQIDTAERWGTAAEATAALDVRRALAAGKRPWSGACDVLVVGEKIGGEGQRTHAKGSASPLTLYPKSSRSCLVLLHLTVIHQ